MVCGGRQQNIPSGDQIRLWNPHYVMRPMLRPGPIITLNPSTTMETVK